MQANVSPRLIERVDGHIQAIWGTTEPDLAQRLIAAIGITNDSDVHESGSVTSRWDQTDIALISYGDSVLGEGTPLQALTELVATRLSDAISIVHVLPFSPYSSDRGFSVVDYTEVDADLGSWHDITTLGEHTGLMFDLVINHISAKSEWFRQFVADTEPGRDYILTADPDEDLSAVVRPRSLPLLTPFETAMGTRHVWTTFSSDQVDLDWSNPDLVCEMLRVIDLYVTRGARLLRLDAICYLWKEPGSSCIHLPQTHEFVKLFHTLLDVRAPHVSIITETNVPDLENRSYFGDSDEAHLIYNFTLPPLAVDGVLHGRADRLVEWLHSSTPPPPGTTFFNFLSSHDGIGVRPAEGFLSDDEIADLVRVTAARGGVHGTYDRGGVPHPYELNISLVDLLGGPDDPRMIDRILLLHSIVFALAGVPAIYINTLMATTNNIEGLEADGVRRTINRGRVHLDDVPSRNGPGWRDHLFTGLIELASIRRGRRSFHPESEQVVDEVDGVLVIERTTLDGHERVRVLCNLTGETRTLDLDGGWSNLVSGIECSGALRIEPYDNVWLQQL